MFFNYVRITELFWLKLVTQIDYDKVMSTQSLSKRIEPIEIIDKVDINVNGVMVRNDCCIYFLRDL